MGLQGETALREISPFAFLVTCMLIFMTAFSFSARNAFLLVFPHASYVFGYETVDKGVDDKQNDRRD